MLFVAKFCLGAWCQDVAEAKRGDITATLEASEGKLASNSRSHH